jgi:hypothetical protein
MHIASTRQRIESAEYGRVKYSLSEPSWASGTRRSNARGETTVVVLGLSGIDFAVEDGQRDVAADIKCLLELAWMLDLDDLEAGREELR